MHTISLYIALLLNAIRSLESHKSLSFIEKRYNYILLSLGIDDGNLRTGVAPEDQQLHLECDNHET